MKNIITGVMSIIITFLVLFIMAALYGRTVRRIELENALNNSMQMAIEMIAEDSQYAPKSNKELVADLHEAMIFNINSAITELTINVIAVDYNKGLMKVEAIAKYPHLSGGEGSVSVTKTIILDYYEEELQKTECNIYYYVYGKLHRSYTVNYGDNAIVPPSPTYDGKTFKGWKMEGEDGETYTDLTELENVIVEKSITLHAMFE